jgi:hypothetical protein
MYLYVVLLQGLQVRRESELAILSSIRQHMIDSLPDSYLIAVNTLSRNA